MKNNRPYWLCSWSLFIGSLQSDGHNFFIRTPFRMLLGFMESPFSLESIHIYLDKIGTHIRSINHEK